VINLIEELVKIIFLPGICVTDIRF